MLNDSHPAVCSVSSAGGSPAGCCSETLPQFPAAATAAFDSDRDSANACIQSAAELLQISGNRKGHRRHASAALRGGLAPWQTKRVADYIDANINSNFRVVDLAAVVRLSATHFFRSFRKSFGETPRAYVTRQRMRRAQIMMLRSREPLAQIALECGMCDQAHFNRVFRKVIGINPSVWRRQFCTQHTT
jgi:AraC family transcriptional regulator